MFSVILKKSVEQSENKIFYESLSSKVYDSFVLKLWCYNHVHNILRIFRG